MRPSLSKQRLVAGCWQTKSRPLATEMEAAGIEPASRNRSEQASTCVSAILIFKPIGLVAARCVSVDPKTNLTFDVFGVIKGDPKKSAGT